MTDKLGAQATVCGGGRYDPLIGMLGGKPAPACGFAIGVERLLDLAVQQGSVPVAETPDVYVVASGAGTDRLALRAAEQLRTAGFDVLMHAGGGSFKSQFKRADASGARLALVIGEAEAERREFGLKWLRASGAAGQGEAATEAARSGGPQQVVPFDALVERVTDALLGDD